MKDNEKLLHSLIRLLARHELLIAAIVFRLEPISKLKKLHFDESRLSKLKSVGAIFLGKPRFVHDSDLLGTCIPCAATDFEIGSSQNGYITK